MALLFILTNVLVSQVCAFESPSVFPISIRQALAEKAKEINPVSQYSAAGWSNRCGTVLTPIHLEPCGVYTADRPFYWNNIDVGCRCTIIELPSSSPGRSKPDLWVHSPVGLDGPLYQAMEKIGQVKYIVSPNYEHVKFAPQWFQSYPDAELWGCPGLPDRIPEVRWKEFPTGIRPLNWKSGFVTGDETMGVGMGPTWDTNIIQPLHINCEKNPFTGRPFFNEVIFFHSPTRTLITTDLFWNYPADQIPNSQFGRNDSWELAPTVDTIPTGSRLWKFGMDKIYAPFFNNFMVTDKSVYRSISDHIVNEWRANTIIPAHGDILRGEGFIEKVLKDHFM